jgi:hypothetical protein
MAEHEGGRNSFPQADPEPSSSPLDDLRSGLKVWADLGVSIGSAVEQQTRNMNSLLAKLERWTPVDYVAIASGVFPASGNLVLNLGSPDQGTYWEVMSCAAGGTDVNVTAAGTGGLYVSGFTPTTGTTASAGMTGLVDRASSFPNVAFYGTRQLLVQDQEYLYLVIFGGTPGQTYVANANVTVYNVASGGGKTSIIG